MGDRNTAPFEQINRDLSWVVAPIPSPGEHESCAVGVERPNGVCYHVDTSGAIDHQYARAAKEARGPSARRARQWCDGSIHGARTLSIGAAASAGRVRRDAAVIKKAAALRLALADSTGEWCPVTRGRSRVRCRAMPPRRRYRLFGRRSWQEPVYPPVAPVPPATFGIGALVGEHRGRRVHKWAHFLPAYDENLGRFRGGFPELSGGRRPLRLLEIGVRHGGSLQLWRKYLGSEAVIWGIDIDPRCRAVDDDDLVIRIGSQADEVFLHGVVAEMGGVDVIVDDGSHVAEHQRTSFRALYPLLTNGGVYVVEDLHTSYSAHHGGGFGRRGGFIENVKEMVDDMHAWCHGRPTAFAEDGTGIARISIHDGIVFIEKAALTIPTRFKVGRKSF